jgi:hypothetical protein
LIFVFDPLAITLVIATNQAFKGKRKYDDTNEVIHKVNDFEEDINVSHKEETDQVPTKYRPSTDQVEPIIIEKIVEVPVEVIKEVEKIVEVPVYIEKEKTLDDELFETESLFDLQQKEEMDDVQQEQIKTEVVQVEPKRLSYNNRNGGSVRINRF